MILWRQEWQSTPVFLPGESHRQRGLAGYSPWGCKKSGTTEQLTLSLTLGFPKSSVGKESAYNAGDLGSIPGLGISPGEGKGYPLQYSGLENSMDYGLWGRKESDTNERSEHT